MMEACVAGYSTIIKELPLLCNGNWRILLALRYCKHQLPRLLLEVQHISLDFQYGYKITCIDIDETPLICS